jgi:hypothetical protein
MLQFMEENMKRLVVGTALVAALCIGSGELKAGTWKIGKDNKAAYDAYCAMFGTNYEGVFSYLGGKIAAVMQTLEDYSDDQKYGAESANARKQAETVKKSLKTAFEFFEGFSENLKTDKMEKTAMKNLDKIIGDFEAALINLVDATSIKNGRGVALILAFNDIVKGLFCVKILNYGTVEAQKIVEMRNRFLVALERVCGQAQSIASTDTFVVASKPFTDKVVEECKKIVNAESQAQTQAQAQAQAQAQVPVVQSQPVSYTPTPVQTQSAAASSFGARRF